ncbi:DMT family transporter [Breznakiella homolactica]|uniref:DMT family transporter n=1 Tax=Breznakiella homolactica TaxID=2798577 RepID=A0A7T7XMG9_9SPIR|nr:DMT family transporter [Breznakiella homolactica]QQO09075.1 DMT family transporter [Breznakiella homolactica]
MSNYVGEIAALATSVCWTFTALCFEFAAKRIGSIALNILRLLAALIFFTIAGIILRGEPIPFSAGREVWIWLSISGLVGFVFGDIFLFQSYIDIGARMAQVVFVSSPLITAVLGFFVFGERISPLGITGMLIVTAAIVFVILDRSPDKPDRSAAAPGASSRRIRGIVFAFFAALGQSGGLILSKIGAPASDPIAATHIRVIAGLLGFIVLALCMGQIKAPLRGLRDLPAVRSLTLGAFIGPFMGVTLGLVAMQRTSSGVAATLMGLTPILILIPDAIIKKEKIRIKEVIGAIAAVGGAALIFIQ